MGWQPVLDRQATIGTTHNNLIQHVVAYYISGGATEHVNALVLIFFLYISQGKKKALVTLSQSHANSKIKTELPYSIWFDVPRVVGDCGLVCGLVFWYGLDCGLCCGLVRSQVWRSWWQVAFETIVPPGWVGAARFVI